MMTHAEARAVLNEAVKGHDPSYYPLTSDLQWLGAIGVLESGYGSGTATNNWGSIQCNHAPPSKDGECVELTDHKKDGTAFRWPYRVFQTPEAGARAMIDLILRKWPQAIQRASEGKTLEASRALFGYYTGVLPKHLRSLPEPAARDYLTRAHAAAVSERAAKIATALGEKLYLDRVDPPGKIKAANRATPWIAFVLVAAPLVGLTVLKGRR